MTEQEFYMCAGYLASPARATNIEVEMPLSRQASFIQQYAQWTGGYPLPARTDTAPYYVWREGANKYGLEARAYFSADDSMPQCLEEELEPRRYQNRPGYEGWERRISQNRFIICLFQHGFVLGENQDTDRIRRSIPQEYLNDFDAGLNI